MNYFLKLKVLGLLVLSLVMISCGNGSSEGEAEEKAASVQGNMFQDKTLQRIYTLQNQRDASGLRVYLQDKHAQYRKAAAIGFASLQAPEAIEPLAALLSDGRETVRSAAAYALGQLKNKKAEPLLINAYTSESSPKVKKDILEAIGKCGTRNGLSFITGLEIDKNQPLLLTGQAWGIYRFALHQVISGQGTALAFELIKPEMPEKVRFIAAHYLARTGGIDLSTYHRQLIRACEIEQNLHTRMALVLALGKAPRPEVLQYLKSILTSGPGLDYRIIVNALRVLGRFNYTDIKALFLEMVSHKDVNIAVTASEYFSGNGREADAVLYFERAKKMNDWRPRTNMLAAALKFVTTKRDKKKISDWIITAYKKSVNNYEKASLLKALAGDITNYPFVESQTFANVGKIPVISTYGMDALVEMSRRVKEDEKMLNIFADIFKRAVESGDPALILFAAGILRDPVMNFKQIYTDTGFLSTALKGCQLPEDLEGWLELRKTINFFNGTRVSASPSPLKNHPIDWELAASIPPDQRVRLKTGKGDITIQLLVNDAPGSVSNFVKLIKENFYKQGVVHRVVPNFVIQDGCPRGDGVGGPAFTIGSELGPLYYDEGSVGMASAGKDTEGSQWFITHSPTPHLDGRYTIFAKVAAGMEVVHKIEIGDKILGFELIQK
ncbi:MAG: peptidylprolyl isomerase [Candidatus Aminicenantes bacterium]|nr:MAG: peptidylprolyl isomerase [Candidatus Aminicenantes bacterium]